MSIVLCYADKNRAIMASDGLAVDSNNAKVTENIKKIRRLKSNVLIGYAGNYFLCMDIINKIHDDFNFEQVCNFIQHFIPLQNSRDKRSFMVVGMAQNKCPAIYTISEKDAPSLNYAKYSPVYGGLYPDDFRRGDIYKQNLEKLGAQKGIETTIKMCAMASKLTNSKVISETILFGRK